MIAIDSYTSIKIAIKIAIFRGSVLPPTAEKCDKPIFAAEIEDVCNTAPTGKSAGPDSIPNAFYRTFSGIVAPILEEVYRESKAVVTPGY